MFAQPSFVVAFFPSYEQSIPMACFFSCPIPWLLPLRMLTTRPAATVFVFRKIPSCRLPSRVMLKNTLFYADRRYRCMKGSTIIQPSTVPCSYFLVINFLYTSLPLQMTSFADHFLCRSLPSQITSRFVDVKEMSLSLHRHFEHLGDF